MNPSEDIVTQTARFGEAVRAFTPICANRYAKLMPFKDGIAELRQKGASYRLIRELLATVGIAVAIDTIGNFAREVIDQRTPSRPNRRWYGVRALSESKAAATLPTPSKPQFPFTVAPLVQSGSPEPALSLSPQPSPSQRPANL